MGRFCLLTLLLGLLHLGFAEKCPRQRTSPGKEIICYTPSYDIERLKDAICSCTILVHQGHDLQNLATSEFKDFRKSLKDKKADLRFVLSVNDDRGSLKTSGTVRQEAAARLARLLTEVDGVELNVTAGSKERLVHFVKGLKDEMIRKSNEKAIFLALPTKPEQLAKQFDLKELSKYVDFFTISTHYLVDEEEAFHTFHPSRLMGLFDMLNTDSVVDLIIGMGAPKPKILMAVPASAYKFVLKNQNENTPRSPTKNEEPVALDRKELCDLMSDGEWTLERDDDLTAPYAFKNENWIAFEDKTSIGIKGKYVTLRGLAGLGIRNIENDLKNSCGNSITQEVFQSFSSIKRKTRQAVLSSLENELHSSQISYPNQVKSSGYRIVRVVDTLGQIHAMRENSQTEFSCTRQGYFVHPRSCNRFYRCVKFNQEIDDYSVFEFDCPAGLAFDERTEVCVWPGSISEGSPCPGSSEIAPVPKNRFQCPEHPGYYADPQNCRWFFACFDLGGPHMIPYEFRCPFGLVFDEDKLICEWPWLVPKCGGGGYTHTEYGGHSGGDGHYGGHGGYEGHGGYGGYGGHDGDGGYGGGGGGGGHGGGGYDGHDDGYGGHDTSPVPGGGGYGKKDGGYGGKDSGYGGHGGHGGKDDGYGGHDTSPVPGGGGYGKKDGEYGGKDSGNGGQGGHNGKDDRYGGHDTSPIPGGGGHGGKYDGHGGHGGKDDEHGGHDGRDDDHGGHGGKDDGYGGHGGNGNGQNGKNGGHGDEDGKVNGYGGHDTSPIPGGGGHGGKDDGHGGHGGKDDGHGSDGGMDDKQGGHGEKDDGHGGHGKDDEHGGHGGKNDEHGGHGGKDDRYGGHDTSPIPGGGGHGGRGDDHGEHGGKDDGHAGKNEDHGKHDGKDDDSHNGKNDGHGNQGGKEGGYGVHEFGSEEHVTGIKGSGDSSEYGDYSNVGNYDYIAGSDGGGKTTSSATGGRITSGKPDSGYSVGFTTSGGKQTTGGYRGSVTQQVGHTGSGYSSGGYTSNAGYIGKTKNPGSASSVIATGGTASGSGYSANVGYTGMINGYTKPASTGFTSGGISTGSGYSSNAGLTSNVGYTMTGSADFSTGQGQTGISHTGLSGEGHSSGPAYKVTQNGVRTSNIGSTGEYGNKYSTGNGQFQTSTGFGSASFTGPTPTAVYNQAGYETISSGKGVTTSQFSSPTVQLQGGKTVDGFVTTSDLSSGSFYTQGNTGGIVTSDITQPGYVNTNAGTAGFGYTGEIKNMYSDHSGTAVRGGTSPGVSLAGQPYPDVVISGQTTPGVYLTGQTSSGAAGGGSVRPGIATVNHVTVGPPVITDRRPNIFNGNRGTVGPPITPYQGSTGSKTSTNSLYGSKTTSGYEVTENTGYKINEYHDNGGRGTIRYNNGYVTSKFTESDLQDIRPSYTSLPGSVVSGGRIEGTGETVLNTNLAGGQGFTQKSSATGIYTQEGFTKTGPTKTGITTAQLGGSGSYVIGTSPRPRPNLDHIGEKAFADNVGYKDSSSAAPNTVYVSSTPATGFGQLDNSKITLSSGGTSGQINSYSQTSGQQTDGSTGPAGYTANSISSVSQGFTTPTPILSVEIHNAKQGVIPSTTSGPVTFGTYSNVKSNGIDSQSTSSGQYQGVGSQSTTSGQYQGTGSQFAGAGQYQGTGSQSTASDQYQGTGFQTTGSQITGSNQYQSTGFQSTGSQITGSDQYRGTGYQSSDSGQYQGTGSQSTSSGQYQGTDSQSTTSGQYQGEGSQSTSSGQYQGVGSKSTVSQNTDSNQYQGTGYQTTGSGQYQGTGSQSTSSAQYQGVGYQSTGAGAYQKTGSQSTSSGQYQGLGPQSIGSPLTGSSQNQGTGYQSTTSGQYQGVSSQSTGSSQNQETGYQSTSSGQYQGIGSQSIGSQLTGSSQNKGTEYQSTSSGQYQGIGSQSIGAGQYHGIGSQSTGAGQYQGTGYQSTSSGQYQGTGSQSTTSGQYQGEGSQSTSSGQYQGVGSKSTVSQNTDSNQYQGTGYQTTGSGQYKGTGSQSTSSVQYQGVGYQSTGSGQYRGTGSQSTSSGQYQGIGSQSTDSSEYQGPGFHSTVYKSTGYKQSTDFQSPIVSPTKTPIGFTTGPLEAYQSTAFDAAKISSVSTVRPVIDTGYKTVILPTKIPVIATSQEYSYQDKNYETGPVSTQKPSSLLIKIDFQQPEVTKTGAEYDTSVFSEITNADDKGIFGQRITSRPNVAVSQSSKADQGQIYRGSSGTSSTTNSGYSYTKGGSSQNSVSSSTKDYDQGLVTVPQTVYIPSTTISPEVGVTFRKPFTTPKISYNEPTRRPGSKVEPVTETPGYTYPKPAKQSSTTPQILAYSTSDQGYSAVGKTLAGSQAITAFGGSSGLDFSSQQTKQVTEDQGRGSAKYTPDNAYIDEMKTKYLGTSRPILSIDVEGIQSESGSSTGAYGRPYTTAMTPSITTYNGNYRKTYSTTAGYESTEEKSSSTEIGRGKGRKIIVKLTDLHPLLIGKLGAECTCKADPFDIFRGPDRKHIPIASSIGIVDLANYDESDIYVDIEADKAIEKLKAENAVARIEADKEVLRIEGEKSERFEATTSVPCATSEKQSEKYTGPIIAVYDDSIGKPSSPYLPSSTESPSSTYLLASSAASRRRPTLRVQVGGPSSIVVNVDNNIGSASITSSRTANGRSGKSLFSSDFLTSNTRGKKRFEIEKHHVAALNGGDGDDECARPGLFRHPKLCNKFYVCHWDEWKKKFSRHVFNCPIHLTFDSGAGACNWPSKGPACQDDNLLV